jgi:type IV secretory pathway VirB10-like protein
MISRPLVLVALVIGCITAAGAGAFYAVRQNKADRTPAEAMLAPAESTATAKPSQAVVETEATVSQPAAASAEAVPALASAQPQQQVTPRAVEPAPKPVQERSSRSATRTARAERARTDRQTETKPPASQARVADAPSRDTSSTPATVPPEAQSGTPEPGRLPEIVAAPPVPEFVEVLVPASSVIGLQVSTPISSERARIEDRVEARVTRNVVADGRTAIPEGTRAIGSVTLVERGGKVKDRARLGVRFHTLVLANGTEVPISTDMILREGEGPSGESARKIGGAAVGGAILGAILGGGKGAVIGGATGAGAGTAAVMAGDRNAATLPSGAVVTVKLSAPVSLEVEKN